MTWWQWALLGVFAWLAFGIYGTYRVYVGYGFVMAAHRAEKEGRSPRHVYLVDSAIATKYIVWDGLLNAVFYSGLCLDRRFSNSFRMVTRWGVTFPVFELITERLSRYNEDPTEWWWRRKVAAFIAPFLDGKDPKGFHIRKAG